jgi:transposase
MKTGRIGRTHSLEFKQSAVEASRQPGASIAGVAMAHGINANPLHKWRRQFSGALNTVTVSTPSLIPVTVVRDEPARSPGDNSTPGRIDIERGSARVSLTGRVDLDVLHTVLATLRPR